MADTLAYRATVDVTMPGRKVEQDGLLYLPVGAEDDDQRISLLVATKVLERAPEHDGEDAPKRRKRR